MLRQINTFLRRNKIFRCCDLRESNDNRNSIDSRHQGIPGFNQTSLSSAKIAIIGAGGIGSEIWEGLARKGVGTIWGIDGDTVELSNLNRQKFSRRDIGGKKAIQLARNIQKEGYMGTVIIPLHYFFQEVVAKNIAIDPDIIVCGVDNDPTRKFASEYGLKHGIPIIFTAVSEDANHGYVFVQEAKGPCFGCLFPDSIKNNKYLCPGTPAVKDILKIVGGLILYAIDTIVMDRARNWNYREIHLSGYANDVKTRIKHKPNCPLCLKSGDSIEFKKESK